MNHKILKRLSLDKESVLTLNDIQMNAIVGGSEALGAAIGAAVSYIAVGAAGAETSGASLYAGAAVTGMCTYAGVVGCEVVNNWYNAYTWNNNNYQNSTNSLYRQDGVCILPDVIVTP